MCLLSSTKISEIKHEELWKTLAVLRRTFGTSVATLEIEYLEYQIRCLVSKVVISVPNLEVRTTTVSVFRSSSWMMWNTCKEFDWSRKFSWKTRQRVHISKIRYIHMCMSKNELSNTFIVIDESLDENIKRLQISNVWKSETFEILKRLKISNVWKYQTFANLKRLQISNVCKS